MSVSPHEGSGAASGLIIPDNIPGDDLKPSKLEEAAGTLRTAGTSSLAQATMAEDTWAGLPSVLESPQGPTIYAALGTPSEAARTIERKFYRVSDALDDFAAALRPIKTTFSQIKTDAVAFRATIRWDEKVWISPRETQEYEFDSLASTAASRGYVRTADEVIEYLQGRGERTMLSGGRVKILAHWTQSSEHIDQNNALMDRLADAYTKLQNAEADCANAINRQRDLCMVDVEYIEAWQLKQSGENTIVLPWGSRVDEERNCGESFWWGAGNAGKEALEGAGTLIGRDPLSGEFSWEMAGQGWLGALQGIGSLVIMTFPPSYLLGQLGVPVFKEAYDLTTGMGKGLLAWDTWAENPSEAAGRVLVNVGSMFIPGVGEVGAAIKAISAGSRIVNLAGDAASLTDNVLAGINKVDGLDTNFTNLVGDAAGAGTKMDDLVSVGIKMPDGDVLHVGAKADTTPPPPPSSFVDSPPGPRPHAGEPTHPAPHSGGADAPSRSRIDPDGPSTPRVDPDGSTTPHGGDGPGAPHGGDGPDSPTPGHGADGADSTPRTTTDEPGPNGPGAGGDTTPPSPREYQMMDGKPHTSAYAPEQLPPSRVTDEFLASHGTTRADFIDIVNTRYSDLTPHQMTILENVRGALGVFDPDTVFQKVLDQPHFVQPKAGEVVDYPATPYPGTSPADTAKLVYSQADQVLLRDLPTMGGSVTVIDDTSRFTSTQTLHDALRLDYDNTHFRPDNPATNGIRSMHVIRFQVDGDPSVFKPPLNSEFGGVGPMVEELDARSAPFSGKGFTASLDDIVPEYMGGGTMREGAEIWEVLENGNQRLFAVLRNGEWIPQG